MMETTDPSSKQPGLLWLKKGISKCRTSYKIRVIPKGSCWLYSSRKAAENKVFYEKYCVPQEEKNTNFISK